MMGQWAMKEMKGTQKKREALRMMMMMMMMMTLDLQAAEKLIS